MLTHPDNRADIEDAQRSGKSPPALRFLYHGRPYSWHPNRLVARLQSWREYARWNDGLLECALEHHRSIGFDIAHHLTYSTWRVASPLWQMPIPFIWGPVGGVASYPLHLLGALSPSAVGLEVARNLSNITARRGRSLKNCAQKSATIFASNKETLAFLRPIRGSESGLHLLSPASFSPEKIRLFGGESFSPKPNGALQIFAGGSLVGSKGVAFALRALKLVKKHGVQFHFIVASDGPEVSFLKKQCSKLGLDSEVTFNNGYRGSAYADKLRESHIFLLPSFRENAPFTIMEAMLARCVPVVVNASAQGELVDDACGFLAPTDSARGIVEFLADSIVKLDQDRDLLAQMGMNAHIKIRDNYSQQQYLDTILTTYDSLASKPNR